MRQRPICDPYTPKMKTAPRDSCKVLCHRGEREREYECVIQKHDVIFYELCICGMITNAMLGIHMVIMSKTMMTRMLIMRRQCSLLYRIGAQ